MTHCVIEDAKLVSQKLRRLLKEDKFDQDEALEALDELDSCIESGEEYANEWQEDRDSTEAEANEWEDKYYKEHEKCEDFEDQVSTLVAQLSEKPPWNLQSDPFRFWYEENIYEPRTAAAYL